MFIWNIQRQDFVEGLCERVDRCRALADDRVQGIPRFVCLHIAIYVSHIEVTTNPGKMDSTVHCVDAIDDGVCLTLYFINQIQLTECN